MQIVLLGYMASGKSSIGKRVAKSLNISFIDLDDYIIDKENQSIANIFSSKGEIYFRQIEHLYLKEILEKKKNVILSLGGGTPCYANNMELISQSNNTTSIFLDTNLDVLTERLFYQKENRPLIKKINSKENLKTFIAKHLFERRDFYNKSEYILKLVDEDTDFVVDQLQSIYDKVTS